MSNMQTGFARRSITPPLGTQMCGYFEPHVAREIITPLYANAAVFHGSNGHTAALVSCDVLFISRESVERVRAAVEAQCELPASAVLIAATHNHTGPATDAVFDAQPDPVYIALLETRIVEAVAAAQAALAPVSLQFSTSIETRVSINRRMLMRDGTAHTHITDEDLPDVVAREGTADQEVGVLTVSDAARNLRGMMINFALHPTNVRGDRICADFPGYLGEFIREQMGPGVSTVFLNGPCGDTDSNTDFVKRVAHSPERARLIGAALGETVREAAGHAEPIESGNVRSVQQLLQIPLKRVPDERVALAHRVLENPEPTEWVFSKGTLRPSPQKERVCAREAILVAERAACCPYANVEVQAIRLGDLVLLAVPVELFTEYGVQIKEAIRVRFPFAMVVELANGAFGYVPTRKAFATGGYETRVARSSQLAPEAGDMIVDASRGLLERLAAMAASQA
ncbi:MAG: hypothetical protein GWP08_20815 [Nitrospiraceae bacterium]|nr:hypothetical protein [Nitrospiraceae bacterium]